MYVNKYFYIPMRLFRLSLNCFVKKVSGNNFKYKYDVVLKAIRKITMF